MERFIGRESELSSLNKKYATDKFQMAIIYGRRRIGKTTLLRKFCKNKKSVFFTAIKTTADRNIELFSKTVVNSLAPELKGISLNTVEDIFSFLADKCSTERIVVVIDELPYLAKKDESFTSYLQKFIDEYFTSGKMFLILCGSSVSFMEDEVLSEKSPLFGRRTMQISLKPFNFRQTGLFLPSWSSYDKAIAYGITGGIAKYIALIDENLSIDENIINLFFTKEGYLYEEADNLLTQEFREVDTYGRIIETISLGANQVTEIADKTGVATQNISYFLRSLLETGIIQKKSAITEEHNKKKIIYVLNDEMLSFWYRFIPDAIETIEAGNGEKYYYRNVKPLLNSYMGNIFEKMCRQFLIEEGMNGLFPCCISQVGTWWGTNPEKKEQTDIDVVGIDKLNKEAVIGECKFRNEITDKAVYDALTERRSLLKGSYIVKELLIFSLSGFSDWLINEEKNGKVMLFCLDDLYNGQ